MYTKLILIAGIMAVFAILSFDAHAETAVTIDVTKGPAFDEGFTMIDLLVPERPSMAKPLNLGDLVFFRGVDPPFMGEGKIIDIYDTTDDTIRKVIILDHKSYQ